MTKQDPYVEFAKLFKERENPPIQGVSTGIVITASPLIIAVNDFILDSERLVVAAHLLPQTKNTTPAITVSNTSVGDHGYHTHTVGMESITFTDTLIAGDKVIVIPSADNQTYYVIDKVGEV